MTRMLPHHIRDIDEAVRSLVSTAHAPDGSFVRTPLLYVSGASVVVRVEAADRDGTWFVSDYGMGFMEAEMLGATSGYRRHARIVANNAGVKFDSNAIFVAEVVKDQLAGAIVTIGNCSRDAVAIAALKLSERKSTEDQTILYERLVRVFSSAKVVREAELAGSSNTVWPISNVVMLDGHPKAIFETVAVHQYSVVNAAAKFHDLALLDEPPNRVAVVRDKEDLGTWLNVLAQSADVIQFSVPDTTIRRFAA